MHREELAKTMRLTSDKELKYSDLGERRTGPTASDFIPASDPDLYAVLEEMETPTTVDEVVDHLIQPANPSIETWADVHERLYEERLPALDESGSVEFDHVRGTVSVCESEPDDTQLVTRALVGAVSILILVVLFVVI